MRSASRVDLFAPAAHLALWRLAAFPSSRRGIHSQGKADRIGYG
jgi:hypothetical protein